MLRQCAAAERGVQLFFLVPAWDIAPAFMCHLPGKRAATVWRMRRSNARRAGAAPISATNERAGPFRRIDPTLHVVSVQSVHLGAQKDAQPVRLILMEQHLKR